MATVNKNPSIKSYVRSPVPLDNIPGTIPKYTEDEYRKIQLALDSAVKAIIDLQARVTALEPK